MDKKETIRLLKATCVGIGIVEKHNSKFRVVGVGGSGFVVGTDGFVLTAWHVIENINKEIKKLRKKKRKVELGALLVQLKEGNSIIHPLPIVYRYRINLTMPTYYPAGTDYDIGLGRMLGKYNIPCLKIKKPTVLKVYEDIFICGYPGGNITFNLKKDKSGVRTSPLIQSGKIAGLMPGDNTKKPWGVQTDIIGTSGSSGSPMVSMDDGKVVGVVQRGVTGNVFNKNEKYLGEAYVGLVWGISNYYLNRSLKEGLKIAREELDEYGRLKSEFKDRTTTDFVFRVGDLAKD